MSDKQTFNEQMKHWRQLADAATEGPWSRLTDDSGEWDISDEDAAFLLAAREAVPALLDRVADLEAVPPGFEDAVRVWAGWLEAAANGDRSKLGTVIEAMQHPIDRIIRMHDRVAELEKEQTSISGALEAIRGCAIDLNCPPVNVPNLVIAEHIRQDMVKIDGLLREYFGDDAEHLGQPYGDGFDAIIAGIKGLADRVVELEAERSEVIKACGFDIDDDPEAPKTLPDYVRETQRMAVQSAEEWTSDYKDAAVRRLSRSSESLRVRVKELEEEAARVNYEMEALALVSSEREAELTQMVSERKGVRASAVRSTLNSRLKEK